MSLALLLSLAASPRSHAATLAVSTTDDELLVNGNCSLREAIESFTSNSAVDACPAPDAQDDTIILPAGVYTLTQGELAIDRSGSLALIGAGAGQTIIDAGNASRAFAISGGANVTISGVTIRNANGAGQSGGAIFADGATLTVRNSVIADSRARYGAGIYVNDSTLTVEDSTISGNVAATRGGGIFSYSSNTTIVNTTIYDNSVTGTEDAGPYDGGGIRTCHTSTITIRNSTIAGNSAAGDGGGIANSTDSPATVTLSNTILAGNSDGGGNAPDCIGAIGSGGYNLVGNPNGCGFAAGGTGDLTNADPQLGPLQDNGGLTPTMAIAESSPARDAGDPACAGADQRGIARPQGGRCDIGAFEYVGAPTIAALSPSAALAGDPELTLTVTGSNFVSGLSTVRWNGAPRATTWVSSRELQATIPASDLAAAGTASVTVHTSLPTDGGTSDGATFTINNPTPTIGGLSPSAATAGSGEITLTITGSGFVSDSTAHWNGSPRDTTFVSGTQLTVSIPASDLAAAGTASVTVVNPGPGGGTSDGATFTINNPAPTLGSLSPARVPLGGAAFTLAVTGTGFVDGSVVRWAGDDRPTSLVSGTRLEASIPASDLLATGEIAVTVFNPGPGGGSSAALTVTIFGPPTITAQPADQEIADGSSATLTVEAEGEEPLSYQWYIGASGDDSSPIAGATAASLTVTPSASSSYWVRVSNAAGSVDSDAATVRLIGAPEITGQPASQAIFLGQTATLTVTATGEGLTYQWYEGGSGDTSAPIAGATGPSLTTPALTATTSYWVQVTNSVGTSANSDAATVTVHGPPAIVAQPASQAIFLGQTATLTVTATGEGLTYQWYEGGSGDTSTPIAGATGPSLTTPALTATTSYWVRVSNPAGDADSATATVTVGPAPNPAPTLSALSPATVTAGGPGFRLALTGSGFTADSVARWNGQVRATTFVSATRLEIEVSAQDIAAPGSATITVFTPAPGGGLSAPLTLTIAAPDEAPRLRVFLPMVVKG